MADVSGIGQAMCYIRPVQCDLDMLPDIASNEVTTEMCLGRGIEMPKK